MMTAPAQTLLLLLVPGLPLLMAGLSLVLARPARLLWLGAVPGLAAALWLPAGAAVAVPGVLLGVGLRLDGPGAVFLGLAGGLWVAAGAYAGAYLGGGPRERSFGVFWNLVLAGTMGAMVAADAATFYVAFALLSLAAWVLVVHDGTEAAARAGRVYLVLAVLGEVCLLMGLLIASTAAQSLEIGDMRAALAGPLAGTPLGGWAVLALVLGFGLKAGLVPVHVWLPLAHAAAPVPASAVLSGAIVKAGIVGLIRFLPGDGALAGWGAALTGLGLLTAWWGILAGLPQRHPKAVLAYSTMSQMGLIVALLGAGLAAGTAAAQDAAALYALHHGLAKGALFLAVGVLAATAAPGARRAALAAVAFLGAAVAGLPLTGGALAKLALKPPLGEGWAATAATLSAVGTMLLMLRLLWLLAREPAPAAGRRPPAGLWGPFAALGLAAVAAPWALWPALSGEGWAYPLAPANLRAAAWPVLAALGIAALAWRGGLRAPALPPGDVVIFGERAAGPLRRLLAAGPEGEPRRERAGLAGGLAAGRAAERVEARLRPWAAGGAVLLLLALGLLAALPLGGG
jgi:hydrogenase-4 component B